MNGDLSFLKGEIPLNPPFLKGEIGGLKKEKYVIL